MINKKTEIKNKRNILKKYIYLVIILIYVFGLYVGFVYSLKSGQIADYINNVLVVKDSIKMQDTAFSGHFIRNYIADTLYILFALIFKYSGVLKGLFIAPVFIYGIHKSVIYVNAIKNGISIWNLIFRMVIRDTAVLAIIVFYMGIIFLEIIYNRYDLKNDAQKLLVCVIVTIIINLINFTVVNLL